MLEIDDFIRYAVSLDPNEFQLKGSDTNILLRPNVEIGIIIDGIRFENVKSITIENTKVTVYYGHDMAMKEFPSVNEFIIDGYSWEDVLNDTEG